MVASVYMPKYSAGPCQLVTSKSQLVILLITINADFCSGYFTEQFILVCSSSCHTLNSCTTM